MPGLRTFLFAFCLGQGLLMWWMSGQYEPTSTSAAEPEKQTVKRTTDARQQLVVWSASSSHGKTWGNKTRDVITFAGTGCEGSGKAIKLDFQGNGEWEGCGLNWKGWFPEDACDDASKCRVLTFMIRQVTDHLDADLTVNLKDNIKRPTPMPMSNPVPVIGSGSLTRIDGTWRKVVLPLNKFTENKDLDLARLWGIDFSYSGNKPVAFEVDCISFGFDQPSSPKFQTTESYTARGKVELNGPTHAIADEIYGVCDLPVDKLSRYGITIARFGGNRSSRHHWKFNADNAGKDWFFKNGGYRINNLNDSTYMRFVREQQAAGGAAYLTIPMLGYVAKDHDSYSFSVKKYGKQDATESGHPDIGNGLTMERLAIRNNDPLDTSVAVGPDFIAEAVRYVSQHAGRGNASKPGVKYWVLDNEPMLWHKTHRDVRKAPVSYDELWDLTVKYAEAIKREDPTAKVAGFCSWGWTDLFYSAADEGRDEYRSHSDHNAHGRMPIGEWFIKKCADYRKLHGKPLVDVFDIHWYPQAQVDGRDPYQAHGMDLKLNQLRLRTTRDLWDPSYTPESWTKDAAGGGPAMVLRRAKEWIAKHDPAMELALGEYNFGGSDNITGGLAQADVLGILAREQVNLGFIWNTPEGTQELAWKLYRDYDGRGSRFGDRYIHSTSSTHDLCIHAAKRTKDGATTIVVINKNLNGEAKTTIDLNLKGQMRLYRFDQQTGNDVVEVSKDAQEINGSISLTLPAASATLIVVK